MIIDFIKMYLFLIICYKTGDDDTRVLDLLFYYVQDSWSMCAAEKLCLIM